MVKAGMSNRDALTAATTNAAELMGLRGKIGVVAPGARAGWARGVDFGDVTFGNVARRSLRQHGEARARPCRPRP
jgi:cytosine/adenosine deaminase-related metal-dependent hydrolase